MYLHARCQRFAARANDLQRHGRIDRCPLLLAEHHPHRMGGLRGQFVELQRREQADDAAWLDTHGLGQARRAVEVSIGQLVESAADLLEDAFVTQAL